MREPLDIQQAMLCGQLVNCAYSMFRRDPTKLTPEPHRTDLPQEYELVAWLVMSDFIFWHREPESFYGLMVRHRERKHEFVVALRGTEGWVEWLDDVFVGLIPFRPAFGTIRVSSGFDRIYSTLRIIRRRQASEGASEASASEAREPHGSIALSFGEQLEKVADELEGAPLHDEIGAGRVTRPRRSCAVTGHSLGAALATLFVMENKAKHKFDISSLCTFASPRVGDADFAREFDELPIASWRIVNKRDLVPKIPPHVWRLMPYKHVDHSCPFSSDGTARSGLVCAHSMGTYMHWLNPAYPLDSQCGPGRKTT